ncbi:hypothetical protein ACJJH9_05160 [Microbulbifer sp. DLAB2-AF]|uniref:hypothetical protein n=1 Tax=Microbulbifer sp. DLAB2-AF TaxID=3243395 RepID=UPI0040392AED
MNQELEEQEFEKYCLAEEAIKDILYMYYVCADYRCLFSDFGTEDGKFDPFAYVDCTAESIGGEGLDINLLHEGAAIKMACYILQAWDQGGYPEVKTDMILNIQECLRQGRLDHLPQLREFIELALKSGVEAEEKSPEIYKEYVAGYFRRLIGENT